MPTVAGEFTLRIETSATPDFGLDAGRLAKMWEDWKICHD